MKKFILSLGLIAMAFGLTNCTQNDDLGTQESNAGIPFELASTISRTTNDGVNTLWEEHDAMNVFHAEAESDLFVRDNQFTIDDVATGNFKGSLAGELTMEYYDWYASYPYYETNNYTRPGTGCSFIIGNTNTVGKQTQSGNNSMSHLAGNQLPLVGVAKGVAATETPSLTMQHAASVAKFIVKNTLSEAITVNSISFNIPDQPLTGYFYIDFTNIENIAYSAQTNGTSDTALLEVKNGEAIAAGEQAEFYLAVVPFTTEDGNEATFTINATSENGVTGQCVKSTSSVLTFTAGKYKNITLSYNTPFESLPSVSTESEPYIVRFEESEGFIEDGNFKVADARATGAEGKEWITVYGKPSATDNILGEQSMQIRLYKIDNAWTVGYTYTSFVLTSVKELQFDAKNTSGNDVLISYRTAGGNWVDLTTIEVLSSAKTYNYVFDEVVKNAQFKFTLVDNNPDNDTRLYIDNVVFSATELPENFRPVAATVKATTKGASSTDTTEGTTATLNGSYTLLDATGSETVTCGFEYKLANSTTYTSVTATSATTFSAEVTNLTTGSEYTYRAWASLDGGATKSYGEDVVFTVTRVSSEVGGKWVRVTSVDMVLSGGIFILGYEETANSGIIVPMRNDGAAAKTTADGTFHAGTKSGNTTNGTINISTISDTTAYELTFTPNSSCANTINIQLANGNYIGQGTSNSGRGRLYTSAGAATAYSVEMDSNNTVILKTKNSGITNNSNNILKYNSSSKYFAHYAAGQKNPVLYKWVE